MSQAIDEKEKILDLKKIKFHGINFVIKKINPLLDFPSDMVPSIFTDIQSARKESEKQQTFNLKEFEWSQKLMTVVIKAGVYKPILIPPDKENPYHEKGLTIKDIFLDMELASKLYEEIMLHSLYRFRGLSKLFFSRRIRRYLFSQWRPSMVALQ